MFEKSSITQAVSSVYKSLQNQIIKQYDIKDVEESYDITDKILKIHGLDKDRFSIINSIEKLIEGRLNDESIDDNSNKGEKTVKGLLKESEICIDKLIGYRYLYRKLNSIYGKRESNRLTGLMYDYSLALADSSSIMNPYCWSFDASTLVTTGKPFGQLPSKPVKRFDSYISLLNEILHQMSNHTSGALAIGTFFIDIAHLLILKEGKNIDDLKNKKYRKHIENQYQRFVHGVNSLSRSGGQECVTEDTEVLTPSGFKTHKNLKADDDIYTWKDGFLNVQKVKRVNIHEYDGDMVEFRGRDIVQTVTPNHRVLNKKFNSNEYVLEDAIKLTKKKTPIDIPIAFKGIINDKEYPISDELLKLSTIVFCDGSFSVEKGKSTRITISKSFKRFGQEEIEELLNNLNYVYRESIEITSFKNCDISESLKEKKYKIKQYRLNVDSSKTISELFNNTKKVLPFWFLKLSKRQAGIVLDTWSNYDGCGGTNTNDEKMKLQCDNKNIADSLQHLALIAGFGSRVICRRIGNNKVDTIYVGVYKKNNKSASEKNIIKYKGIVWCPTTDDGIVVYRKEGRIFISGNSPFTNVSLFDRIKLRKIIDEDYAWYFSSLEDTKRIDTEYVVEFIIELQNIYMEFFDKGDPCSNGLPYRFPVSTINLSKKKDKNNEWIIQDKKFLKSICKKDIYRYNIFTSEGSKIASCCRLLTDSDMLGLASQSNSFGGGSSVSLGSHRVVTINFVRLALQSDTIDDFYKILNKRIDDSKKILFAHKQLIYDMKDLSVFLKQGWMRLNRMFSTVGIIGVYETSEIMKKKFKELKDVDFIKDMLSYLNSELNDSNEEYKGCLFNIEQIPAESMSHRLANVDKILYSEEQQPYDIYSNQFIPLWEKISIHGRMSEDGKYNALLTGGGISHINTGEHVTNKQAEKLIEFSIASGCEHFAITGTFCCCEEGHTVLGDTDKCSVCGANIKTKIARTVGFWTPVEDWSSYKQKYDHERRVEYKNKDFDIE